MIVCSVDIGGIVEHPLLNCNTIGIQHPYTIVVKHIKTESDEYNWFLVVK